MRTVLVAIFLSAGLASNAAASPGLVVQNAHSAALMHAPGTPNCFAAVPVHGDPRSQPSVFLMRGESGCAVPWHWHSASENIIITAGHARAQVRGHEWTTLTTGDFISVVPKQTMRFACVDRCTLYLYSDGPFTLHYVDAHEKEISPIQALKP